MQLRDVTALVTGASSGIGAATARRLHERGERLVLHGRDAERLGRLADELGARTVSSDLADEGAARHLADQVGPVGVAVLNAGIGLRKPFADTDPDAIDRLLRVNLTAPLQLTRQADRRLALASGGRLASLFGCRH